MINPPADFTFAYSRAYISQDRIGSVTGTARYRNLALFVALAAMWGSSFVGIKAGLAYFPAVLFAAFRYDIAAVLLFAYAIGTTDRVWPRGMAEWIDVAVSGALIIGAFQALLFLGEQFTTSAVAAILVSTSPILVTGFSRLLLPDERLSLLGLVGLAVGFVGVGIVTRPDPAALLAGDVIGELLIVASAACFAFGSVLTQVVEDDVSLGVESREAWAMGIGAVLMHAASSGLGESVGAIQWTTSGLTALVYLAVIPSAVGYLVYFDLLDRVGPIDVNLVSSVNPVFAALIGWVVLGERLSVVTIIGFLIVFTGFALLKHEELTARVRRAVAPGELT